MWLYFIRILINENYVKSIVMKKVNLYCLLISVLCLIFIWGCGQGTELENSNDSLEVEINLAKSLSVNKQDLKLIGFKTFYVSDENERIKIKNLHL